MKQFVHPCGAHRSRQRVTFFDSGIRFLGILSQGWRPVKSIFAPHYHIVIRKRLCDIAAVLVGCTYVGFRVFFCPYDFYKGRRPSFKLLPCPGSVVKEIFGNFLAARIAQVVSVSFLTTE